MLIRLPFQGHILAGPWEPLHVIEATGKTICPREPVGARSGLQGHRRTRSCKDTGKDVSSWGKNKLTEPDTDSMAVPASELQTALQTSPRTQPAGLWEEPEVQPQPSTAEPLRNVPEAGALPWNPAARGPGASLWGEAGAAHAGHSCFQPGLQGTAEPVSNASGTSGKMYLRKGKMPQRWWGMRKKVRNSPTGAEIWGGGGGTPSARAIN